MSERDAERTVHEEDDPSQKQDELQPGDFYFEGQYMVFTEAYHLRRGYCCNSGCRHCPYR